MTAKRSHPSDLGTDKSPVLEKVVNIDLQSDSGYSSHTAATMSSADSATSATAQSPPVVPVNAAPIPQPSPAIKRRPTIGDDRKSSSQSSPRKPLQRTGSVSSRNRPPRERRQTTTDEDCTDPNCTKCGPNARGRKSKPSPLDSGLDISSPPSDQRSQRSDPAPASSYVSPQSPIYNRQPDPYVRGPAVIQPAATSRRRSSSAARPVSYHGGDPTQGYWVPGMPNPYPSPPQEHGPPPAMSAYHGMPVPIPMHNAHPQIHGYGMVGASPQNPFYAPHHPIQQTSPPYDSMQRPPLSARISSGYPRPRPSSQYGPALLTQDTNPRDMPSARYASNAPGSARQERFPQKQLAQTQYESESSDYDSSGEELEETRDRALMPPPKLRTSAQRRPSLRRPKTIQDYPSEHRMSQSMTLEPPRDRGRESRSNRGSRLSTAAPSRATSTSRPALVQHPKAQSAYETARAAKVVVENPANRRRQSYQGYERQYDESRRRSKMYAEEEPRRRSKVYQDEGVALPEDSRRHSKVYRDEGIIMPERRRRPTDADSQRQRRDRDDIVEQPNYREKTNDVEEYLRRTRGSEAPLNDRVHRDAKRASRIPSGPSETGSSRSGDKASHVSHSNRSTVTSGGGGGEIRLRVDASQALKLQFNGDMEGRTLEIKPAEDGMADIVIGDARTGNENTYRSERGSIYSGSKKSVVAGRTERARRDAEESSVRSARSSQSRRTRDDERRPLRRKGETVYRE